MAGSAYNDKGQQAQLYKFNGNEVLEGEGIPTTLNLMNFNARLYNPALGVFLAVDPQNQFANPYLAFGNNPVLMVDPDGELAFVPFLVVLAKAAAIGAGIGGAGYTASVAFSEGGGQNWNAGQFWNSVGVGAISGVVTAGIGSAFGAVGSAGIGGEVGRAFAHGYSNMMIGAAFGQDPTLASFASGALGSLAGSALNKAGNFAQIGGSSLVGGIGAELSGGDFWRGAATGATVSILNHGAHKAIYGDGLAQGEPLKKLPKGKVVYTKRDENTGTTVYGIEVDGKVKYYIEYTDPYKVPMEPWLGMGHNGIVVNYREIPRTLINFGSRAGFIGANIMSAGRMGWDGFWNDHYRGNIWLLNYSGKYLAINGPK